MCWWEYLRTYDAEVRDGPLYALLECLSVVILCLLGSNAWTADIVCCVLGGAVLRIVTARQPDYI